MPGPENVGDRPWKRRRQVSSYPRGSVLRVEVKNFMTYKHAVIEPGPKLNLVLGPNGTGKSSLVCAICVGLAGKTSLLGRAEDVASFVRRGEQAGWVEITLSSGDPMRPHKVRRDINAQDNHSVWTLNGREARMKDVEELVRDKLKIQLDNLCQFLPQDKVVEFARMKPVDLLEATEKAIGNGQLYDQHLALIDARKQLREHDHHKEALVASLEQLKAENARQENARDVQNIQRRDQLLEEARAAEAKLPWVRYQGRKRQYDADKQKRDEARRQLEELKQAHAEDEGPLRRAQQAHDKLKAKKVGVEREMREADARLAGGPTAGRGGGQQQTSLCDELMDLTEEANQKAEEINGLEREAAAREQRVAGLEADVARLTEEVEALPPVGDTGDLGRQQQQLRREMMDLGQQDSSLAFQLEEKKGERDAAARDKAAAEARLRRIDDSKMKRLQALDQRYRGIHAAWQWVQANGGRFKRPVYGPIAVEVECPDPTHVNYLEQQVAGNVWSFFVTQDREDQDLLNAECARMNPPFRPSIANYVSSPQQIDAAIVHPKGEASQYASYGITQTLDQVFTAPNIVKKVLCDESRIQEAYVGGSRTDVEALFAAHRGISMVYTPAALYKRTRSQYNASAESTLVADVRHAKLLTGASGADDATERATALAEIKRCNRDIAALGAEIAQLEADKGEKGRQVAAAKQRIERLTAQMREAQRRHTELRTKLKSKAGELERLKKQPDPRKKGPKLALAMEEAQRKAHTKALEMVELTAAQADRIARIAALDLGMREAAMQVERIREASKARQDRVARMQTVVNQLTQLVAQGADECRRLKPQGEVTEEMKAVWAGFPEELAELELFIDGKRDEADAMRISNPAALRQYQVRCGQIADAEADLATVEDRRQLARNTIDGVTAEWLPRLKQIVTQVSATFSDNFQCVGCAGEVVLHEAPEEDFEHYAIEIRVKFRDAEALQTLDANRQSGGERSVSTILYLIALQGVTVTPFRVVDEINQGMDPVNERKVFMQLVDAACRDGTPQCFLLTPKLLPGLPYTADVTVLQIMNGADIKQVAAGFTMEKLVGAQRMRQLVHAAA